MKPIYPRYNLWRLALVSLWSSDGAVGLWYNVPQPTHPPDLIQSEPVRDINTRTYRTPAEWDLKIQKPPLGLHTLTAVVLSHCYTLCCLPQCVCVLACVFGLFLCKLCMWRHCYGVKKMCVFLYVWVCTRLVFPGLHFRVALGTKSPGCNTLIAELFTLYTNLLHPVWEGSSAFGMAACRHFYSLVCSTASCSRIFMVLVWVF